MATEPVSVTVFSRDECHLCDEAIETLETVADDEGIAVAIDERDVDADPELRERYGDRVPYVLIDGSPAFKYRVDPERARSKLRAAAE